MKFGGESLIIKGQFKKFQDSKNVEIYAEN